MYHWHLVIISTEAPLVVIPLTRSEITTSLKETPVSPNSARIY